MSELTMYGEDMNLREQTGRKSLAQRFAAHVKETKAWFDELSRKTGYRYPIAY